MAELDKDQLEALARGIGKSGVATETTLKALVRALGGDTGMKAVAQATGKTAKEMKTMASYLQDVNEELEDTEQGLTRLQKVNNTLSIGIGIVTTNLAGLGSSARMIGEQFGTVGEVFGDTLGYLIDRLSENVDFYRSISQIGGAAGQSISDLRMAAGETGLTMGQLTDAITQAGGNLALLGGTTGVGVKRFTNALKDLAQGETFEKFSALGFTMQEIATGAAEYLELQTQLGRTQTMTERELSSETADYLNNLDLLSRLTGKNRQALQQEMQERAKDARLSLQLAGMSQKQQREINSALSMTGNVSKEMEQSIRNLIATDGVATNAREAGIMAIDGMREALHGLARGESGSAQQLMKVFQGAANETAQMSAEERQRYAQLKQLGVDFFDVRFETIGFKNALGDLEVATEEQVKAQEIGAKSALLFDKSTQRLRTAFQALLAPIVDMLNPAIGLLASAIEQLVSFFDFLKKELGAFGTGLSAVTAVLATMYTGKLASAGVGVAAKGGKKLMSYLPGMGGGGGGSSILGKAGAGAGGMLGGVGAGMKGLAGGLASFANPATILGATSFAASIAIIGAGLAAATWLMGGALEKFASGLGAVGEVDGKNLMAVAKGSTALAGAMALMSVGTTASAVTGFFGKIFGAGPENFAKNLNKTLDELDKNKIDMYANSLENLGNAMTSLRSGMTGTITASSSSTGDKLDRLNNTMEQILMTMNDNNRYSRITSQATQDTAENFG
jgi:hypothetical protein